MEHQAVAEKYDLHIEMSAEMRQRLRDLAKLAYKMGEIDKPTLAALMSRFIIWGSLVLEKKWQAHMLIKWREHDGRRE